MPETRFPIKKQKTSCMIYPALLFCIGGVVVAIANMVLNFSFASVVGGLLLGFVLGYLAYFIIKGLLDKSERALVVDDYGIQTIGIYLIKDQKIPWLLITSVDVIYNQFQKQNILTIKFPTSNIPIQVVENSVDDFNDMCTTVKEYFENTQRLARQASAAPTAEVTQTDVDAVRKYCRHLAEEWWQENGGDGAICDGCNAPISKGGGTLIGSYLYCASCANEKFGIGALRNLRSDPNFFGRGVLERAREFTQEQ